MCNTQLIGYNQRHTGCLLRLRKEMPYPEKKTHWKVHKKNVPPTGKIKGGLLDQPWYLNKDNSLLMSLTHVLWKTAFPSAWGKVASSLQELRLHWATFRNSWWVFGHCISHQLMGTIWHLQGERWCRSWDPRYLLETFLFSWVNRCHQAA